MVFLKIHRRPLSQGMKKKEEGRMQKSTWRARSSLGGKLGMGGRYLDWSFGRCKDVRDRMWGGGRGGGNSERFQ